MLPCVGARVIMRTLWQDPAIRWVLGRPYVFIDEFYKVATPFMVTAESAAVEAESCGQPVAMTIGSGYFHGFSSQN